MAHFLLWFIGEEVTPWKIKMISKNECFDFTQFSEEQNSYSDPSNFLNQEELRGWKKRESSCDGAGLTGEKKELREKWSKLMVDPLFTPLIIPDRKVFTT